MRVLLVEDNPIDAATLADRLVEHKGVAVELEHVTSLADLASRDPSAFDALLLDLSLPDGNGIASLRQARTLLGDLPIVVLTADDNEQRSLEMLREGAEDYLVKGKYDADALVRALRYACERNALKQRLTHADRLAAVGQLSAGVAHEVANPAALAIANTAKLLDLLEGVSTRRLPQSVLADCIRLTEDNRNALERIRAVVRDLQAYARLERSRVEHVQLNDIAERTCNLVYASLRHGATLERRFATLPTIAADEGKIEQVLTNLLINAIHALERTERKDKRIIVATFVERRVEGDQICMSVIDNGCGMTESVRQRVFEPFFTTKRDHGTGLGLAIAIEIVKRHRGEIICTSTVGEGSRFDVRIPLETGLSLPEIEIKAVSEPSIRPRGRVLLIDDERSVALVYGDLLGMHHEVVIAHGGRDAQTVLERDKRFDVIVCDLMMPELDGVALFEDVRIHAPELESRFVFCSGGLVTPRARELASRPTTRLLYKPVSIDDMLRTIDTVMTEHGGALRGVSRPPAS